METLTVMAMRQGGLVTRSQAMACGMTSRTIAHRTGSGRWRIESKGVYRLLPALDERDLLSGATSVLKGSVVSHGSAARLLALPLVTRVQAEVTVADSATHTLPGVLVHRTRRPLEPDIVTQDGLPVTSIARTLIDLASSLEADDWADAVDALVLKDRALLSRIGRVARRVSGRGRSGSAVVGAYLRQRTQVLGRSELEARGLALLETYGIDGGQAEFPLPWDPRRRFDVGFPSARLAVEWDSRQWHGSINAMASDRARDREAALHDWLIVRYTWTDVVDSPAEVAASLGRLIARRTAGPGIR